MRPTSRQEGIYATLPKALTQELKVKTKEGGDKEVLRQRKELVATKSISELSQIHSFAEIPLPTWHHHHQAAENGQVFRESCKTN